MKADFYPLQAADNLKKYMQTVQDAHPKMHFFNKSGEPIAKQISDYLDVLEVRTVRSLLKGEDKERKDKIFSVMQEKTGISADYWRGIISHPARTKEEADKEKEIIAAFDQMEKQQEEDQKQEENEMAALFARIGFSYSTREYPTPDGIEDLHVIAPIGFPEEAQELTGGELRVLFSGMSDLVEVALLKKRRASRAEVDRGPDPDQAGPRI